MNSPLKAVFELAMGALFALSIWPAPHAFAMLLKGEQKLLVVMVDFQNEAVFDKLKTYHLASNNQDVRKYFFEGKGRESVDGYYREVSNGLMWITGEVRGHIRIPQKNTDPCERFIWADEADEQLKRQGVNLASFDRFMYILPANNNCPYGGYGDMGGRRAWSNGSLGVFVGAHELGHTLGLDHASTDTNVYGDLSDVMGGGYIVQLNAPHKEQLGWIPENKIQTIDKSGLYSISPLELAPKDAKAPQILKIKLDANSVLALSFRQPIGMDELFTDPALNRVVPLKKQTLGVTIHQNSQNHPVYLETLEDGKVHTHSTVRIQQLRHDPQMVWIKITMKP